MNHWSNWGGWLLVVLLAPGPPRACGQDFNSGRAAQQAQNAHWERMRREQAVARVGPVARGLVEAYGDDACKALLMCSPPIGRNLAVFFNSGELDRQIPRPRELLAAIGSPGAGNVVAWWCLQHASELHDIHACDAFLGDPVSYALNLKVLEVGAAQVRASRVAAAARAEVPQAHNAPAPQWPDNVGPRAIALWCAAAGLIVLAAWWKRRRQQTALIGP